MAVMPLAPSLASVRPGVLGPGVTFAQSDLDLQWVSQPWVMGEWVCRHTRVGGTHQLRWARAKQGLRK